MDHQRILIDTSILIEHLRRTNKESSAFYRATQRFNCSISTVTEFEFRVGSTPANRDFITDLLKLTPILPFDSLCVQVAADVYRILKTTNRLIPLPDLFIAATAVAHDLPLLTLNVNHFERVERLALIDLASL